MPDVVQPFMESPGIWDFEVSDMSGERFPGDGMYKWRAVAALSVQIIRGPPLMQMKVVIQSYFSILRFDWKTLNCYRNIYAWLLNNTDMSAFTAD